ncbi:MAG: acetyl/propionyl/methylcrotonyl-CoA carboxylase subunit alpha [Acidimicrobiales bacterium]
MSPTPIRRLLVANRGEIAGRIMRTASGMGIQTVAVYADGDAGAPFVTQADAAFALGGRSAAETYLDIDKLLAVARRSGADAIHPGYGFGSENPYFAQAVLDADLTWVGPPPAAIAAMGDKLEAKKLMAAAGVPVLASAELATDQALGKVDLGGWPVLVKAAAGGGGKGMRIVRDPADLAAAVAAAQREAQASFGDPRVFVERYLVDARHVEVQVLADHHGQVLHCFERECSIQRRHQKIIEEAPSPAVDAGLRARITDAAVAAAKAIGYRNAGTVEFVLAPDGAFYFLEVNTRLQVEHPVTEAVTGLDLVREQLLVAAGHPLGFAQADLEINGHAIEARIYAEDPAAGFLPATGTLAGWAPAPDPPLRWDSGVAEGSVVGVDFDPMLAKVIAHAPTRREAADTLALGLERSVIRGVTTNRDFLVATLRHQEFLDGKATTSFVERADVALRSDAPPEAVRHAAVIAALAAQAARRANAQVLASLPAGWRNSVMPPERVTFRHREDEVAVEYRARRDGSFAVVAGEEQLSARVRAWDGRVLDVELAGRRHRGAPHHQGQTRWVEIDGTDIELVERSRLPEPESETIPGGLVAPMPGKVLAVEVAAGQHVDEGALLVIVEAMKMEHRVTAPHRGTVVEVRVATGDQVSGGDLLVVLEELGGAVEAAK